MFARKLVAFMATRSRVGLTKTSNYSFYSQDCATTTQPQTMKDVKEKIVMKLGIESTFNPKLRSREYLLQHEPKPENLPARSMQDSFTSAVIPLSSSPTLHDRYVTARGHVRLGRLMEDMDLFAVWVVHKHLHVLNANPDIPLPFTFVTILVDKISFTDLEPKHDSDIRLSGHVSWVGTSSVEVVVWLEQLCDGKWAKLTRALFLMASRNATNTKALRVNSLVPANEKEKEILAGGEARKKSRIDRQKHSLFNVSPNPVEQKLIHDMFVQSIDMKNVNFNQRILPPGSIWMDNTFESTLIFSHPEDRNAHNTVFGGFLMRHALELSYILARRISAHRPKLVNISDISFNRAVAVSSFIKMHAHLIYTHENYMQIVVIAEVLDPETKEQLTSNVFYYTYQDTDNVPSVMPKTYHEAMWYLDGRRRFLNAMDLDDSPEAPILSIDQN